MALSVPHVLAMAVSSAGCPCVGQKSLLRAGRSTSAGMKQSSQQTQEQTHPSCKPVSIPSEMQSPYKIGLFQHNIWCSARSEQFIRLVLREWPVPERTSPCGG
ncbi:hypothetical protein BU23DRAFT_160060 [Bimuria novae-zelandiae CBS 107.79]|uniref:Uncharacterized protein n=1 Tax=Bimuria novae-zelandiae CBS 107.79 TaxID=1447943 RepID=A0A6A5V5L9_9PLEO|nr:hypothetical protein BU23DRAFT_160060 [Bimuria novae-zelandiae CBS 107.79]